MTFVAPLAGAWIEMIVAWLKLYKIKVAPLAGAWIEIKSERLQKEGKMSLPLRERGLK